MSPSARTKQYLEGQGCKMVKLEHWNHFAKQRKDAWGADWLVRQGSLGMALQVTDDSNHSKRVNKWMTQTDKAGNIMITNWLKIGIRCYVYSWGLKGAAGERKKYELRVTQLVLDENDKVVVL